MKKLFGQVTAIRTRQADADEANLNRMGRFRLRCNLCNATFRGNSRFLRFCRTCRVQDEAYRFAE